MVDVAGRKSRFTLPPLAILCVVCFLVVGELVSGTELQFVAMMAVGVLSACLTYNLLGGLGSISGVAFSGFAISTLIVGQFGKVLLLEPADRNLRVPDLTITVYAVYFLFLMLGTFLFFRIRLPLPKPLEPMTSVQTRKLYTVALAGGLLGTVIGMSLQGPGGAESLTHGFARALDYLIPFSLVLAVDDKIRVTEGRHCIGWRVLPPAAVLLLEGFMGGGRTEFVEPFLLIFLACYLRGYRFGRKHYIAGGALAAFFFLFVSPFFLYSREFRGQATNREQFTVMERALESAPAQWGTIVNRVSTAALEAHGSVNYFDATWAVTLNRFALIGPDSTLIDACARNYHYGFTSLRLDLMSQVPRFVNKNKTDYGSKEFLGHLDGQESDAFVTTSSTITPISDSFGAFGFLGTIVFPFLVPPLIFIIFESIFDGSRPWGTVALVTLGFEFVAGSMGDKIVGTMIREPIYLVTISWVAGWIARMIPSGEDRRKGFTAGESLLRASS